MSDINKLVENYFAPKSKALGKEKLWEIFDEVYEGLSLIKEEGTQEKEMTLPLPSFKLSEKWGDPENADRKEVAKFFNKIAPGLSLKDKIDNIADFIKECDIQCSEDSKVSEVLPRLVFLEILTSILNDYDPRAGGYLFEAFLAALLDEYKGRMPAGAGQLEDLIIDLDKESNEEDKIVSPLSIKLIKKGREASGSIDLLKKTWAKYRQPVKYIIASKRDNKALNIIFYEFVLSPEVFEDRTKVGIKPSGKGFYIKSAAYEQNPIAEINLGTAEKLKKIGQQYADGIGKHMFEMYALLKTIGTNLNEYFLEDSKSAAANAQAAAKSLEASIAEETI